MKKWTFMVYMAGDNGKIFDDGDDGKRLFHDLQQYGWNDIAEMASVGSTDQVAVIAQYDTLDQSQYTPRFHIDQSGSTGKLVETVSPVNTGDPGNLTDFIVWAMSEYPAEKYALVLWNHGTGWKEDDIYARYRERVEKAIRAGETRAGAMGERLLRHAFFLSTAGEIMSIEDDETRAICYDDTSMDFLDNQKLAQAFSDAEKQTGQRLSLIGMDACLMSTIEVAYQIRGFADLMVGSQEVEQAYGWPYKRILKKLVNDPGMNALNLGCLIVEEFGKYYTSLNRDGGGINTQSAINLKGLAVTFEKMKYISELIAENYSSDINTELAISRAKQKSKCFKDEDSVDLRDLMKKIRDAYSGDLPLADMADDIIKHLEPEAGNGPVTANFHGLSRPWANGLSIYFPPKRYSLFYDKQAFTASGWNRVIRKANCLED